MVKAAAAVKPTVTGNEMKSTSEPETKVKIRQI